MGRGGGSGGSHHSSHHSRSHSHSGGSRSSSRSSYRSSSGSSYRSSRSSSSHHSRTRHYSGSGGYTGGGRSNESCLGGCLRVFIGPLFIIAMCVVMAFSILIARGDEIRVPFELTIERSTVQRERLPDSKCDPIDEWYQDDWGDWIDDTEADEDFSLRVGLKSFYEDTGVQPYLWIMGEEGKDYMSEGSLEELGDVRYKEMFGDDEGHVLVIFREYPNESGNYICTVTAGYDAETQVIDDQAKEILLDYIDYYYTDEDLNEGEFFETAFMRAGERIMTKQLSWKQIYVIIGVAIVAVVGIVIVSSIIKARKIAVAQQKAKQAQAEAEQKQAEAARVQTEFDQQQYQDALEKEYVSVTCPNCGATANKIRKGTVDYCKFCGTAISVDAIGQAFIGDIYHQQQNYPPQS